MSVFELSRQAVDRGDCLRMCAVYVINNKCASLSASVTESIAPAGSPPESTAAAASVNPARTSTARSLATSTGAVAPSSRGAPRRRHHPMGQQALDRGRSCRIRRWPPPPPFDDHHMTGGIGAEAHGATAGAWTSPLPRRPTPLACRLPNQVPPTLPMARCADQRPVDNRSGAVKIPMDRRPGI
jgi:hypothetical protein